MEYLFEVLAFSAKTVILVIGLFLALLCIVLVKRIAKNKDDNQESRIKVVDLREKFADRKAFMEDALEECDHAFKDDKKAKDKKESKKEDKSSDKNNTEDQKSSEDKRREHLDELTKDGYFCPKNLFVIGFYGDVKASSLSILTRKIDAVLDVATPQDEVILKLYSPGGLVNSYGLAASQLARIRDRGIRLTVCVDEVAASGGYLMACVASRIIAAPFAYIGSIGVVASIPNFHRLLEKYDVDYEQVTAGKYKRTVTMFGKNTDEDRQKLRQDLELIHMRFKQVVTRYRPQLQLKIDDIATGEHWLAEDAKERGLVDEIASSNSYIAKRIDETYGSAVKLVWRRKKKKSILLKVKKLVCARTWVKAVKRELANTENVNDKLL